MSVVNKALAFRKAQEQELAWDDQSSAGCAHCQAKKLGDVTTLNVTMLRSGVSLDGGKTFALNVIPATAEAGFDVRIAPELATAEFKKMLDAWCRDEGLSWRFVPWVETLEEHYVTKPSETPLFGVLEDALGKACPDVRVEREIFPAGTDSQFLRAVGIPAVGLSLLPNTPVLLHEHNESLSVATFLKGIDTYCHVIDNLASAEQLPGEQQDGKCRQNGKKRKMLDGLDPDAS